MESLETVDKISVSGLFCCYLQDKRLRNFLYHI